MNRNGTIKISKGVDIFIPGTAVACLADAEQVSYCAVKPTDFVGVSPRLLVAEGNSVRVGSPLFVDKNNEAALFVSPVSGTVTRIVRGEKRALQAVVVASDGSFCPLNNEPVEVSSVDRDRLVQWMVRQGLWTLLRQRPFGVAPSLNDTPKAVFISAFDSSPLPVDYDFVLKGREADFQTGLDALRKLVGEVHLSLHDRQRSSWLAQSKGVQVHYFAGPHPAGLVGTHISRISPINKGERVWTVEAQDVAVLGRSLREGHYASERVVALCGPCVAQPQYYSLGGGASMNFVSKLLSPVESAVSESASCRCICGDVLSGVSVSTAVDEATSLPAGFLSAGVSKVCVVPEGDHYDFMGWLRPNVRKMSLSRTFLSGFFAGRKGAVTEHCTIDTGVHGSRRPLFVTGEFEKLVALDIYPLQLIKACIVGDIEQMEHLGIYEVEPEDLALCEFADTSKTEIQLIVRKALEQLRIEN